MGMTHHRIWNRKYCFDEKKWIFGDSLAIEPGIRIIKHDRMSADFMETLFELINMVLTGN